MSNSQAASTGLDTGAIDPNEFQKMSTALKIVETLTRMDQKVVTLESTVRQNSARIDKLRQRAHTVPYVRRDVAEIKKNLNQLGVSHNLEVNGLKLELEKKLNEMGQSIRREIASVKDGLSKDITALKDGDIVKLNHVASVAKTIGAIGLAAITSGVLVKLFWH
jgi:uncharacterized phage infection (PIP) family protein YhgE